jgi:hypothetical protein
MLVQYYIDIIHWHCLPQTRVTLIVTLLVFATLCDMRLIGPILFVSGHPL